MSFSFQSLSVAVLASSAAIGLLAPQLSHAHNSDLLEWVTIEKQSRQNVVQITAKNKADYVAISISFHGELLESDPNTLTHTLNLSDSQLKRVQESKMAVQPALHWLEKRDQQLAKLLRPKDKTTQPGIPGFSCYATVEETYSEAQQLAITHSNLASWIDVGDSWQKTQNNNGYDLMVLKLTNSSIGGNKPKLFVHSAMHAREYTPAALNLDFARDLLNNYNTKADNRWLLDHHEIHLMFQMNPDGRKIAETGILWRKNNNINHCPNGAAGVDLNRNFSFFWNTTPGGSSGAQCAETYRGTSASSEPETQAVENYLRSIFPDSRGTDINDAAPADTSGIHIDIHSYSELVLWPWGHTTDPAPNAVPLQTLGRKLAKFNDYYPQQSVGLYPTDGTSDDISYGELGIAHYTFELGTGFFQPCSDYTDTIRDPNLQALYYAAKTARAPYQLPSGPDVINLQGNLSDNPAVVAGDLLTLTFNADDTRFSSANGVEPSQLIADAVVYLDTPPWQNPGQSFRASASDGALDSNQEALQLEMDTSNWSNGTHTLFVQAEDAEGNLGAVSAIFVTVGNNASPIPSFSRQCVNLECSFDATASTDDGTITDYLWNFGNNQTASGATTSHSFSTAGAYEVTLTIVDNLGLSAYSSQTVTVTAAPTTATPAPSSGGGSLLWLIGLCSGLVLRCRKQV